MKLDSITFIYFAILIEIYGQKSDNTWVLSRWGNTGKFNTTTFQFNDSLSFKIYKDTKVEIYQSNASISDSLGNLLLFSNGEQLFNRNFTPLKGEKGINFDSTYVASNQDLNQNVLFLPFPNKKNQYAFFYSSNYIFPGPLFTGAAAKDLKMAIIDMEKDNGLGEVIIRRQFIIKDLLDYGKITAVKHANGRDWWVLVQKDRANIYYKVLLSPTGAVLHDTQQIGIDNDDTVGQAVFSPDGKYYVNFDIVNEQDSISPELNVFEFDRCTGQLSNPRHVFYKKKDSFSGGAAISPNSRYLYISRFKKLYQYDLWAKDLAASQILIDTFDGYRHEGKYPTLFHQAQLAPNGKIYVSSAGSAPYLHVINQPNLRGDSCQFVQRGQELPTYNAFSVPNHPNYRLGALKGSPCDTLGLGVATKDIEKEEVKIFPNPAQDILNIEIIAETLQNIDFKLFNIQGALLKKQIISSAQQTTDISDLSNGMYIIEIRQAGKVLKKEKIVVLRE